MIELIATYFLLPFAKKLGDKVINEAVDEAVDKTDAGLKKLFKSVFNGSGDKQELLNRLKEDPRAAAQFERISAKLAQQMSIVTSSADKLECYASVLEGLGAIAVRSERHLVIAGFLNGTNYVTVIAPPDFKNNPKADRRDGTVFAFNTGPAPMDIYLKRCKSSKERDEEVIKLRKLVEENSNIIPPETVKEFYSLTYIYPGWISLKGLKYGDVGLDEPNASSSRPTQNERIKNRERREQREKYDNHFIPNFSILPEPLRDLLKISNFDGLALMIKSVTEFIKEQAKELNKAKKASGARKK